MTVRATAIHAETQTSRAPITDVDAAAPRLGRNRIATRALERVVSAVTADELGVKAREVGVQLDDDNGSLVVSARAAVSIISLTAQGRKARAAEAAGTVIDRAKATQMAIRENVRNMTGSRIGAVNVRFDAVRIDGEERVL